MNDNIVATSLVKASLGTHAISEDGERHRTGENGSSIHAVRVDTDTNTAGKLNNTQTHYHQQKTHITNRIIITNRDGNMTRS